MTDKIKICGLMGLEDIGAVNQAMPDYVGFVFAKSRRQISEKMADRMRSALDSEIPAVGVFVNQNKEQIIRLCQEEIIQLVQLHGQEDAAFIVELKSRISCPIIKAVSGNTPFDIQKGGGAGADFLLLDNKDGGTGQSFDWNLIPKIHTPFFLAGGLKAENIRQARTYGAYCLDISSGVETDGKKDPEKIYRITEEVHQLR